MNVTKPTSDAQAKRWREACEHAAAALDGDDASAEYAEEEARALLGLARYLGGVACKACSGQGERAYDSTSTWRAGIGGQTVTGGVCDKCWGTGRSDRLGPSLRELAILAGTRPLLELHSTSSGNPPGVGGMAPASSAMWIRARGQWYRVTTEKSAHKVVQAILQAVGAEEWG